MEMTIFGRLPVNKSAARNAQHECVMRSEGQQVGAGLLTELWFLFEDDFAH